MYEDLISRVCHLWLGLLGQPFMGAVDQIKIWTAPQKSESAGPFLDLRSRNSVILFYQIIFRHVKLNYLDMLLAANSAAI